jgi:hypothetical protein
MTQEELLELRNEIQQYEASQKRMGEYKQTYDENMANQLGYYHAHYPWLAPEILVPMVFSGQTEIIPEAAKAAARDMMEIGMTPQMMSNEYQEKYVPRMVGRVE